MPNSAKPHKYMCSLSCRYYFKKKYYDNFTPYFSNVPEIVVVSQTNYQEYHH